MNALDANFIEDEEVRDYLRKLKDDAASTCNAVPPSSLKGFLERYPLVRQGIFEACERAETIWRERKECFQSDESDEASREQTLDDFIQEDEYEEEQAAQVRSQCTFAEVADYRVRHSRSQAALIAALMRDARTREECSAYHADKAKEYRQLAEDVRAAKLITTQEQSNDNAN